VLDVPDQLAAMFAATTGDGRGWLRRVIDTEFRRNGARTPVAVAAWLDAVEAHQRAARVSTAGPATFPPVHGVTVSDYATRAGVTVQAVRGRCRRGTLPAVMVDGRWLILEDR
jgi:hypothetical protein